MFAGLGLLARCAMCRFNLSGSLPKEPAAKQLCSRRTADVPCRELISSGFILTELLGVAVSVFGVLRFRLAGSSHVRCLL